MGEYESVLMVASRYRIAAYLPYLQKLIYGYNARTVRTRRIHLVWQIDDIGKAGIVFYLAELTVTDIGLAAQSLLNKALDEGCVSAILAICCLYY